MHPLALQHEGREPAPLTPRSASKDLNASSHVTVDFFDPTCQSRSPSSAITGDENFDIGKRLEDISKRYVRRYWRSTLFRLK